MELNKSIIFVLSLIVDIALTYLNIFHLNVFTFSFGLISIYCFIFMVKFLPEAFQSKNWPQVEGEIVISEIGKLGSGYSASVYPKIEYSYTVDGTTLQSKRIKLGTQSISSKGGDWADKILKKYALGKQLSVYYNPVKPSKATLNTGLNFNILLFGLLALIFLIVGLFFGLLLST